MILDKIKFIYSYFKDLWTYDKNKDFNKFKAKYCFSYLVGLGIMTAIGSVVWIFKDIFILGTNNILLEISLRSVPILCLPIYQFCRKHKAKTWVLTLIIIWLTILANTILDIFAYPSDGLSGEGWISYFVFFFALSIVADRQDFIYLSTILFTILLLITADRYGGPIVYTTNILRPITTGVILNVGLTVVGTTIRKAFTELYDNEVTLRNVAKQDMLTGIFNRHKLDDLINDKGELHRSSTLMIFDIDMFKNINDTYGHIAGDEAIIYAARTLSKSCRNNDIVIRYGGDEFIIILDGFVDTDIIWGKIKENLLVDNKYNVSFSAGSVIGDKDKMLYSLIKKADKGAYASKDKGKSKLTKFEDLGIN